MVQTIRDIPDADAPSIQITEDGVPYPLRALVQEEFCKIGKEAILNALRHAKASNIQVEVHYGRRFFQLICRDDGVGIADGIVRASGKKGHWGLKGMQERARSIGATFSLWTKEGKGTEIEVRLFSSAAYQNPKYLDRLFSWSRIRRRDPM